MSALKFTTFGGMQPRKDIADLPQNYAENSVGVNYYSGDLVPYKESIYERQIPDYSRTIYPFTQEDGTYSWMVSNKRLKITKHHGTANDQRVIISNSGQPLTTDSEKFPEMEFLGVPKPAEDPIAVLGGGGTGVPQSTLYVYTFVNDYGEESEPSNASHAILKKEGQLVLVKIGQDPVINGVDIKKKRIYRSVTTDTTADYFFMAEVPAQQTSFVDTMLNESLGEVLPTTDWNAPPSDLKNIIMLSNGIYVGHTLRKIYFSPPFIPYAFPVKYFIELNTDIVSIEKTGRNSFVVGTTEKPFYIYGDAPDAMSVVEIKGNFPCLPNTMVDMGDGVMFATYQGIVFVSTASKIKIITEKSLAKEVFESQIESDTHAFQDTGQYHLVCKNGTLVLDSFKQDFISYNKEKPNCAYFNSETEELYSALNGNLVKRNSDDTLNKGFIWKTKNIRNPQYVNMSAYRVFADYKINMLSEFDVEEIDSAPIGDFVVGGLLSLTQIQTKIDKTKPYLLITFKRGKKLIFRRFISDDKMYRLPKDYKDDKISFEIQSNIRIREVHVADTPFSLKKV